MERQPHAAPGRFFLLGCIVEGGLGLLGLGLGYWFDLHLLRDLRLRWLEVGVGLASAVPPLLFLFYSTHSPAAFFRRMQAFMETHLLPLLRSMPVWRLAVLSVLAGVGEELLFRGVVQGALVRHLGVVIGVLAASAIFGLVHGATREYAVLAGGAGVYLGLLFHFGQNLLIPVVCHAVYDFVALVYLVRLRRLTQGPESLRSRDGN